jgi:polyhydroxybutyrate depolymerase
MEPTPMKSRRRVLGSVLALISLPLLVAIVEAVSFQVRNRSNGSLVSSSERREYLLYVPKSYDATRPTSLVISMHGGAGWPVLQRDMSGWNRVAERHGFIVAYPAGLDLGGTTGWHVRESTGLTEDVRFISDLIDDLEKAYNIDPTRIYADGLSNGGGMAFVLSCTLSDRIAAVGMVAAAQMLPWSWCTDRRPVPMISFHGTADPVVPYEGGTTWVWDGSFPDVSEWTASWARRNRCGPDSIESAVAPDITRRDYTDCADDAAVVLFTIHGGGHTWPGGQPLPEWFVGPTSREIDASALMWEFFQEHRLGTDGKTEVPDRRTPGEGGPQPARSP